MSEITPALRKHLITNSIRILKDAISFDQFFELDALYYITKDGDDKKVLEITSEDIWSRSNLRETVLTLDSRSTYIKLEPCKVESNTTGINAQPSCSNMGNAAEKKQSSTNSAMKENTPALRKRLITDSIHILKDTISFEQFFKLEAIYYITKDGDNKNSLAISSEDIWSRSNLRETDLTLPPMTSEIKHEHSKHEANSTGISEQPGCSNISYTAEKNQPTNNSELQDHEHGNLDGSGNGPGTDCGSVKIMAFSKKADVTRHQMKTLILECEHCQQKFMSRAVLVEHMEVHIDHKNYYKCRFCFEMFSRRRKLVKHERSHAEMGSSKSPARGSIVKRHGQSHAKRRFRCKICEKSLSRHWDLQKHIRAIHVGEKPFHCETCGKSFALSGHLKSHIRTHTGEKPYHCTICEKSFALSGHLKSHTRIHTGEKPYRCTICEKSFALSGHLKGHTRTHTGEKPYRCTICEKSFALSGHLKSHTRIHTGEKPYHCKICEKSFTQVGGLQYHIRVIHVGEKPFRCESCDKSFAQSGHLKRHMLRHTGEKPYQCSNCLGRFSWNYQLKKHLAVSCGENLD